MKEQLDLAEAQLMDATRELRKKEQEVTELAQAVEDFRNNAHQAEDRVAEFEGELLELGDHFEDLEVELLRWKPMPGDLDENLDALLDSFQILTAP